MFDRVSPPPRRLKLSQSPGEESESPNRADGGVSMDPERGGVVVPILRWPRLGAIPGKFSLEKLQDLCVLIHIVDLAPADLGTRIGPAETLQQP